MEIQDQSVVSAIHHFKKEDGHDAEGTIFQRYEYDSTITGKKEVHWNIARNLKLTPEDVYVRVYNEDGTIDRYVAMPFIQYALREDIKLSTNIVRDLDKIKAAMQEFEDLRKTA